MRKYKIAPRKKTLAWNRRKHLKTVWWMILAVGLGYSARLGADRLGQVVFLPVRSLQIGRLPQAESNVAVWEKMVLDDVEAQWQGKNRFRCALSARRVAGELIKKYPFVKDLNIRWIDFLTKGQARLVARFRVPVARSGASCVDSEGVMFFCPADMKTRRLITMDLKDDARIRQKAYWAIETIEEALAPTRRVVRVSSRGESEVVYEDHAGQAYRISVKDIENLENLKRVRAHLSAVLADLSARQEKFRYIDLSLSQKGRVIVGA